MPVSRSLRRTPEYPVFSLPLGGVKPGVCAAIGARKLDAVRGAVGMSAS